MDTEVNRIFILGVPVDVVTGKNLQTAIEGLYNLPDHRQIVLLDFHEFMKSRHNSERKEALRQAALIIPVSSLIVSAARFLNKDIPTLYKPYPFIIRLLGILEARNKSVYLLGSNMKGVRAAESTLRATFPGVWIVGRYAARFRGNREKDVLTAIKKASPALLLTGKGLKGKHLWISRNRHRFVTGLAIWEKHCFGVFAGKKQKPNDSTGAHLLKGFFGALFRPWRFLRVFRYLYFFILLMVARIRR